MSLPSSSVVLAEPGGIYHFGFRYKTYAGIILCITVTFPGNACLEDDRHQPEGNPGGDQEVEEAVTEPPPENHCSLTGPPLFTVDVAQLPSPWLIGQTGLLWQQMLSLLEEIWYEDWLLELAFLQGNQEEISPAAA